MEQSIFTVKQFCKYVSRDLNGLIRYVSGISRVVSDNELKAYAASYPVVSKMLTQAMKLNPQIGEAHISSTQMLLEYKLPAASAWCDLVLIGTGTNQKPKVIIIELKNFQKNDSDAPGPYEGLFMHQGHVIKHPADQVKGYTLYCQQFHSAVIDADASVDGCVFFTQPIDLAPYQAYPNDTLTTEYPLYNTENVDQLALSVSQKIVGGDPEFAVRFINGFYKQNRNILKQVGDNLRASATTARPFVLLDEQRLGFNLTMSLLEKRFKDRKKEVIIIKGPPGCGKSAIAINLWIEAATRYSHVENGGNIVFVATSGSQENNWSHIFSEYGERYDAGGFVIKANSFNPGMSGSEINDFALNFEDTHPEYLMEGKNGASTLRFDFYEEYTKYMLAHGMTRNYRENLHFISIIDEAHALINPAKPGYKAEKPGGWCLQMGPQAYHIIYESLISVFLLDGKQSYRDTETTSVEDLKDYAKKLNAHVTEVSLEGLQFRCAGSKEYIDWVEALFTTEPIDNHDDWKENFEIKIVDYPSELDDVLRPHIDNRTGSCRILSTYSRPWVSKHELDKMHTTDAPYDFVLEDKGGNEWKRHWNNANGYEIFVQAPVGTKMYEDPLCEVGYPLTVRGFDYDHIGLLWLDDLVYRDGRWMVSLQNLYENDTNSTKKKALEERKQAIRSGAASGKMKDIDLIPGLDPRYPQAMALFTKVAQAYRILMTRSIKSLTIYIKDEETRRHVRSLLK